MIKFFVLTAAILSLALYAAVNEQRVSASAVLSPQHGESDERDFSEREEIRRQFQLSPGAQVEVSSIKGPIEIETSNTSTAEVYIVRSARTREELNFYRLVVEGTPASLRIRRESRDEEGRARVRHRVMLRLPRQIQLTIQSVNGRVRVGEIEGPVAIRSINGSVNITHATRFAEVTSVNGSVTLRLGRLEDRGIRLTSINGAIDLRFTNEVNADLRVTSINGSVDADLPNVSMSRMDRSNFRARIGSGGVPITVSSVNGSLQLRQGE